MLNRNKDALAISDGACNPVAIVNAMARAVEEIRTQTIGDTPSVLEDPALKLMTHQLAYLQGIPTSEDYEEWRKWRKACGDMDG